MQSLPERHRTAMPGDLLQARRPPVRQHEIRLRDPQGLPPLFMDSLLLINRHDGPAFWNATFSCDIPSRLRILQEESILRAPDHPIL